MWFQVFEGSGFNLEFWQLSFENLRLQETSELRYLSISSLRIDQAHCGMETAHYITVMVVGSIIYYFVI